MSKIGVKNEPYALLRVLCDEIAHVLIFSMLMLRKNL